MNASYEWLRTLVPFSLTPTVVLPEIWFPSPAAAPPMVTPSVPVPPVVVEIKSVERFDPIFESQVLTYLRVTGKRVGLLINFNSRLLRDGVKRYVRD